MSQGNQITRRGFLKAAAASAGALLGPGPGLFSGRAAQERARIFRVDGCPVHDGARRHRGVDALLALMARSGLPLFQTSASHPWGSPQGLIAADDVVLLKVNCQWRCRGATNTDLVRGLIHRLLEHPDGFRGEVVIIENGQGRGAFDGLVPAQGAYAAYPGIIGRVRVNAEQENRLTVDYLVNTVFAGQPVSAYLLDDIREIFIGRDDHATDGYRRLREARVSYPCFTTAGGRRVELREGLWDGSAYRSNLKLINIPVLKHHDTNGTGLTGALKNSYGLLSMYDGWSGERHYRDSGLQAGRMYSLVRTPVLHLLDCIWVPFASLRGWPESTVRRLDLLLAGRDPVALDWYAGKRVLLPLGGEYAAVHDPDSYSGLIRHLEDARQTINQNGGLFGQPARSGQASIEVLSARV